MFLDSLSNRDDMTPVFLYTLEIILHILNSTSGIDELLSSQLCHCFPQDKAKNTLIRGSTLSQSVASDFCSLASIDKLDQGWHRLTHFLSIFMII